MVSDGPAKLSRSDISIAASNAVAASHIGQVTITDDTTNLQTQLQSVRNPDTGKDDLQCTISPKKKNTAGRTTMTDRYNFHGLKDSPPAFAGSSVVDTAFGGLYRETGHAALVDLFVMLQPDGDYTIFLQDTFSGKQVGIMLHGNAIQAMGAIAWGSDFTPGPVSPGAFTLPARIASTCVKPNF
jgi:hypothetical protein